MSLRDQARNALLQLLLYRVSGPGAGVRVILLYHSVSLEGAGRGVYTLPLAAFERQMELLQQRFKIVRLCDLAKAMEAEPPDTNLACVTFDDGCLDNYEVALPVLERLGIKATFFVVTGLVGKALRTSAGEVPSMSKENIRELAALGHEVGSHTVSHVKLTQVPIETARAEMQGSKQFLEDLLGSQVVSFAYPKGAYNDAVKEEAARLGFRYAVTIREGLVPRQPDWLALQRVWVSPHLSLSAFPAKVSPAVEWYEWIRGRGR
jgi:peptidoglycan/xylan/chitin deacetylase (PgdA/CDA1 family)